MAEIKEGVGCQVFTHTVDGTDYGFWVPQMPDDCKESFCKSVGLEFNRLHRLTKEKAARDVQLRIQSALGLLGD